MEFDIRLINQNGKALNEAKQLFIDYQQELNVDLCFQSFDKELENPLLKYGSPNGALYVAYAINEPIGCVALQQLPNNTCEMKRLYVVPQYRKHKIGQALVHKIITKAKELAYATMKLDTLTSLQPAIQLYENVGFEHVTAYYNNPLPNVVYMELTL
jgi:putative acetyltransferase